MMKHGLQTRLVNIIEEVYKTICMEITLKKYKEFPSIANGMYRDFARDYLLASEIVAYTDGKIEEESIRRLLRKGSGARSGLLPGRGDASKEEYQEKRSNTVCE